MPFFLCSSWKLKIDFVSKATAYKIFNPLNAKFVFKFKPINFSSINNFKLGINFIIGNPHAKAKDANFLTVSFVGALLKDL